jgi:hypothetical protein
MAPTLNSEELLRSLERTGLVGSDAPLELATALLLAGRAAQLQLLEAVQREAGGLPAPIQALLALPAPGLAPERDALADPAEALLLEDLIDLVSLEETPCIAPRLHRGWQDRRQSCREARRRCGAAVGLSLDAARRAALLEALALIKRVFQLPPPLALEAAALRRGLTALLELCQEAGEGTEVAAAAGRLLEGGRSEPVA